MHPVYLYSHNPVLSRQVANHWQDPCADTVHLHHTKMRPHSLNTCSTGCLYYCTLTDGCAILSHYALHRSDDLFHHRRRHGGGVDRTVRVGSQVLNELLNPAETQEILVEYETILRYIMVKLGYDNFLWTISQHHNMYIEIFHPKASLS